MYWREHFSKHNNLPEQSTTEVSETDDRNPTQTVYEDKDQSAE